MKKFFCFILCTAIFAACFPVCKASAESTAKAEILVEALTGQVLLSQNAEAKVPIASVTKVMTLLLCAEAIERGELSLEEKVRASGEASGTEGATIWLNIGEEMTAAELLEAVIVNSANDACIALAEHLAGSEAEFVKLMNERARELEMNDTRYVCCTGLIDEGNYSTAKDVATVTAELMKHEVLRGWMLTWLDYLRGGETQLVNTNKMVRYYSGLLGGKTGTTDAAGCCITVCAEKKNMRLVAVVLGCEEDQDRFDEAEELLNYGYDNFEKFTPEADRSMLEPIKVRRGTVSEISPVIAAQGAECVIRKGCANRVKYEYTFVEDVEAPVKKGQFLGEYLVTLDGAEVFRSDIVAKSEVQRMNFWRSFLRILTEIVSM